MEGEDTFRFGYIQELPGPNQIKDIKLMLTLATRTNVWLSNHVNRLLVESHTRNLKGGICIRFNREQFDMNFVNLKEKIFERVDIWPISNDLREFVAIQILSDMVQIVESERDNAKLAISCKVTFLESHTIYVEGSSPTVLPASEHSIQALERSVMVANEDGRCATCTICFEDLPVGYEALCMPCSHAFHGDCIRRWLSISHLCPICRHLMPTN